MKKKLILIFLLNINFDKSLSQNNKILIKYSIECISFVSFLYGFKNLKNCCHLCCQIRKNDLRYDEVDEIIEKRNDSATKAIIALLTGGYLQVIKNKIK